MNFNDIEPLEPGLWLRSIGRLARRPLDNEADLERALRHAFHLVQLAPRPLRHMIHCAGSETTFEALLEARAFEGAVLCLLGNRTPYSLTKSGNGHETTAEVWYPGHCERHTATERSAAVALLRAWLECNCAICGQDEPKHATRALSDTTRQTSTEH